MFKVQIEEQGTKNELFIGSLICIDLGIFYDLMDFVSYLLPGIYYLIETKRVC